MQIVDILEKNVKKKLPDNELCKEILRRVPHIKEYSTKRLRLIRTRVNNGRIWNIDYIPAVPFVEYDLDKKPIYAIRQRHKFNIGPEATVKKEL